MKGFSCGFGLSPSPNYQVDYAFVPQGDFGFTHMISLGMRFVPKPVKEEGVKEEIPPEVKKIEEVLPAKKAEKPEVKKPAEKEEIVKKPVVEKQVVVEKPVVEKSVVREEVIKKPEVAAPKEVKKLQELKYMAVVLSDNVTLWSGPGVTYQAITTLNKGTSLRVLDDSKRWYYLVQLDNGTMGWVSYVFVGKE